jgi:glyoxylase-like metal-dependent hydrolase (beta-lactamase superfamily II)
MNTFEVTVVSDGNINLPVSFVLPNAPQAEVDALIATDGKRPETLVGQVNVVVVKTPDAVIMIDTGGGTEFMPGVGLLSDNLERAGIAPDSITHVVFTHAHGDHLWGVIDPFEDGTRFTKARHIMSAVEHEFWLRPDLDTTLPEAQRGMAVGTARRLKSLGERIERIKTGTEILPGVSVIDTAGHTPGHMSVLLKSGSEQLLVGGDVISSPVISFAKPDWPWGPDLDREMGIAARKRTLDMLAADKIGLLGYHLPWPGLARVEKKDAAFRYITG